MKLILKTPTPAREVEVRDEPFTVEELQTLYPQYDRETIESIFQPKPGRYDCSNPDFRLHGAAYLDFVEEDPGGPCCLWGDSDSPDAEFSSVGPRKTQRSGWALIYVWNGEAHLKGETYPGYTPWSGNCGIWAHLHGYEFVEPLLRWKEEAHAAEG